MTKEAGSRARHPDEQRLWAEAVRGVIPLRGRTAPAMQSAPAEVLRPIASAVVGGDAGPNESLSGIDRASSERLKRGRHQIEARLDLHGMTQTEAHRALVEFVEGCCGAGRRCVLVITGRGLGPEGPGVLKSAVPRWLAEPGLRRQVLAIAAAQPRHGGAGALYLLLRRRRLPPHKGQS